MKYRITKEYCIEVLDKKWVRSDIGGHPMRSDTQEILPPFETHQQAEYHLESVFEYTPTQPEEVFNT